MAERRGEAILAGVEKQVSESWLAVETEFVYGGPVDSPAAYAETGGIDGVVVGHRGLSSHVEQMVGSVAKGPVENATVPVTVVRYVSAGRDTSSPPGDGRYLDRWFSSPPEAVSGMKRYSRPESARIPQRTPR